MRSGAMMMQHDKLEGIPIGEPKPEGFEEKMRRIRADMLHAATCNSRGDSPWFAVRVMSGREIAVKNAMEAAGIEALVPMRKGPEYRRRHRVIPATLIPAMTSYVLVRFLPSTQAFLGIRSIEHVIDMLGGCLSPRHIPNAEVMRFNALADEGALDWERPTIVFLKGEKVRVTDGPFASFVGEITSCRNDGKGDAVVELNLFASMTPVLMPLAILEKV